VRQHENPENGQLWRYWNNRIKPKRLYFRACKGNSLCVNVAFFFVTDKHTSQGREKKGQGANSLSIRKKQLDSNLKVETVELNILSTVFFILKTRAA